MYRLISEPLEINKVASMNRRTPGHVVVKFEYSRHIGPKFVHGGVRLRFDSVRPYSSNHAPSCRRTITMRKFGPPWKAPCLNAAERWARAKSCLRVLSGKGDTCATSFEKAARAVT